MESYFGDFRLANLIFQRALAGVFCVAFAAALNQFPALLGQNGFLPVPAFIRQVPFADSPSLFYLAYSDRLFAAVAWAGVLISLAVMLGAFAKGPWWLLSAAWLTLYVLYLSIVNVGQTFYSFGWESMLLEAGFFAAFLGPDSLKPSPVAVLIQRWMLLRLMLGAGLIKLRGDPCWRDLTCLNYHYETQPMPNPLSWYFHLLPAPLLKGGVAVNHFVEVVVPFGLLGPQPVAACAGGFIILHQLLLIASGNFAFLNFLTIALAFTAFSDAALKFLLPAWAPALLPPVRPSPAFFQPFFYALAGITALLSVRPTLNLASSQQVMNYDYNRLHLVNTYGMFGAITKERYEVVVEGTADKRPGPKAEWREYEFKGKPGALGRVPPQVAPYHMRLDWLMWFLPFSVDVTPRGVGVYGYELWFIRFMGKLLQADPATLALLHSDPFGGKPPAYVRARFYRYRFTSPAERKASGAWWKRELVGEYLPPVSLEVLRSEGMEL